MDKLKQLYNNFYQELVSYNDHSKLSRFLINLPDNVSADRLFVRKRKMDFVDLLSFLIMPRAESMAVELMEFYSGLGRDYPTKSAVSQRRKYVSHEVLVKLNEYLINSYYQSGLASKWKGKHIFAVDGTNISLPNSKKYQDLFGKTNTNSKFDKSQARVVYIIDVLNHTIVAAIVGKFFEDESTLAWEAIKNLPYDLRENSIFLFDRLYPSAWLFTLLANHSIQYVMRCRRGFNVEVNRFFDSKEKSQDIKIEPSNLVWEKKTGLRYQKMGIDEKASRPLYLHMTKSALPTGEIEVIASSVYGLRISPLQAYNLYGRRWDSEVVIGQQKNEEQIEIFSGNSPICFLQDIFAKILSFNLCKIAVHQANKLVNKSTIRHRKLPSSKNNHTKPIARQVNMNIAIDLFRSSWQILVTASSPEEIARWITEFIKTLRMYTEAVIPGRHNPRVLKSHKLNGKYITFLNYRRVI